MRQIKFRAWDRTTQEMIDADSWYFSDQFEPFVDSVTNAQQRHDIMQYTGLHDKHGKEVYEGDIVRIANYETEWKLSEPDFDWRVFEIQWNRYTWAYNNSVIYSPLSDYDTRTSEPYDIEVIGNIYENPELLEQS